MGVGGGGGGEGGVVKGGIGGWLQCDIVWFEKAVQPSPLCEYGLML